MNVFSIFKRKQKQPLKPPKPKHTVGLALSGGGAKGFAHIGVIRAFEEVGLTFDVVTGTSVGSLVGALYCAGIDSHKMEEIGKSLKMSEILDKKILLTPSKSQNVEKLVKNAIGEITFEELPKKFACTATNMVNGEEVLLQNGSVALAVSASCSAPIFFDGVQMEDMRLYDGGLVNNLPADATRRLGAEFVVGVTLSNTGIDGTDKTNLFSVAKTTFSIISRSTSIKGIMNSDVLISPVLLGKKSSKIDNANDVEEMIQAGYQATKSKIPQIMELMGIKIKQKNK